MNRKNPWGNFEVGRCTDKEHTKTTEQKARDRRNRETQADIEERQLLKKLGADDDYDYDY